MQSLDHCNAEHSSCLRGPEAGFTLAALLLCLLVGCAETDPYKRLEPAPVPHASPLSGATAFNGRWPRRFTCVQTVTIDFGVVTRTLVGHLIVEQPHRFRLIGMTEHGLQLFDLVGRANGHHVESAAEEFDEKILANIARDIRRVFLDQIPHGKVSTADGHNWFGDIGPVLTGARVHERRSGMVMIMDRDGLEFTLRQIGERYFTDSFELKMDTSRLFRVDQYEWREMLADAEPARFAPNPWREAIPSVIVLRESGLQSQGPRYKLTIRITQIEYREGDWPEGTFADGGR